MHELTKEHVTQVIAMLKTQLEETDRQLAALPELALFSGDTVDAIARLTEVKLRILETLSTFARLR